MKRIETTTKPNGSGSSWIEIGHFSQPDDFGDQKWIPAKDRYPQKDSRLKVQRKYDGKEGSARLRIQWIIDVPEDFPLSIVARARGREVEILFSPGGNKDGE